MVGFTSGIALTIFSTQIKDFFGLTTPPLPSGFIEKWGVYFEHFTTINWWAALIALLSVVIIVLTPKLSRKIPGSLVALVVITAVAYLLKEYAGITSIETIGDRFTINSELPEIEQIPISLRASTFPAAFTIAMLGAIESLLGHGSRRVTGKRHTQHGAGGRVATRPHSRGIPATGAIARTMTINNGGRTR